MKTPSMEHRVTGLFCEVDSSKTIDDMEKEVEVTISHSWMSLLIQNATITSRELLHLHSQHPSHNISWFIGLYLASLLSMSGMMGGVRWMLAFL